MRYISYLFWIIIILLGISFVVLNSRTVLINYYIGEAHVYLPLLLLLELVIGAIIGVLAMLPSVLRNKNSLRKCRQKVKHLEEEIKNLRNIPIKDSH